MDAPVPETSKDTETVTLSKVTSSSSSSFDGKILMVTPKRVFYIEVKLSDQCKKVVNQQVLNCYESIKCKLIGLRS